MKKISFVKAEALSNDFIIVDDRADGSEVFEPGEIIELCDRRLGVGADGILLLQPSDKCDFKMRTLNSDGSEAEMCGNGVRCAAKYVFETGGERNKELRIETLAGAKDILIIEGNQGKTETYRVDLGEPNIDGRESKIEAAGREIVFTGVSIGNPHAVIFVDDVYSIPVEVLGPAIEQHEFFPNKTNVEFARVVGSNLIEMRVWERGAGETAACGTGAAAVLAAAHANGKSGRVATLRLAGGDLLVEWADGGHIYITGGANIVYSGAT